MRRRWRFGRRRHCSQVLPTRRAHVRDTYFYTHVRHNIKLPVFPPSERVLLTPQPVRLYNTLFHTLLLVLVPHNYDIIVCRLRFAFFCRTQYRKNIVRTHTIDSGHTHTSLIHNNNQIHICLPSAVAACVSAGCSNTG